MIALALTVLPDPDSPTTATVCPRPSEYVSPSTARTTRPSLRKSTRSSETSSSDSVTALLQRARRPSPSRLKQTTVMNKAALGSSTYRGLAESVLWPWAIMFPQLGAGGGTPRPMKLSAPSRIITIPIPSRPKLINWGRMFGAM